MVSLSSSSVVAFVPLSFRLGSGPVPLPAYGSPECVALQHSRAYRASRGAGKTWRWAMVDAVVAAVSYHRGTI